MEARDGSDRGDARAYDRYLAAMDAAMRVKIAVTAAHLPAAGTVADMGMGSGTGSDALAALYPRLEVVGVDLDPEMVERARQRFDRPNLRFVMGDIAEPVFDAESLDGVFDSSVIHHVTSFGGYDHDAARRACAAQAAQLRAGGTLVIRDFVAPEEGERAVILALPADDGDDSDDPARCSTARLFERFAGEFRSLHNAPGFPTERLEDAPDGWRRYRLSERHAAEFLLRKDYRTDWVKEAREEYTYFTARGFAEVFEELGLRLLACTPIRNPWIVRNRFEGRFRWEGAGGAFLEPPATHVIVAGEKVAAGAGVRFRRRPCGPVGYLELEGWRDGETGQVLDLVRRPERTLDVLPFFLDEDGDPLVLARTSYPRPVLLAGGPALDGSLPPAYVAEPIVLREGAGPLGTAVEDGLARLAHIPPESLRAFHAGTVTYPSPGGVLEEVRSVLVELRGDAPLLRDAPAGSSGFATPGRIRALDARQLLRAAQVGALPDARLELHAYQLFATLGVSPGPWIGEVIALEGADDPGPPPTPLAELLARPPRRRFARTEARAGFLEVHAETFEELDAKGRRLATQDLEYVTPGPLSLRTLACALLRQVGVEVRMAVDDDARPASQCFDGNSQLLVAPAWRLPHDLPSPTPARAWVRARLEEEHGLRLGQAWELGGRYHPTPGLTPEVVHPLAFEVLAAPEDDRLAWVPLAELAARASDLRDGHLRLVALRAAHALDLLR